MTIRRPTLMLATLALVTGPAACDGIMGIDPVLHVQTVENFHAREDGSVRLRYRVTNVSDEPLRLNRCDGAINPVVERRDGEDWESLYSGICLHDGTSPTALAPGASEEGAINIREPGMMRILVGAYGSPLALWGSSNLFWVF